MPPHSNARKAPTVTTAVTNLADVSSAPRRTASGRTVRANTTRPANYYARPFDSTNTAVGAGGGDNNVDGSEDPGFFPALQFFSDAIAALPKEVIRQFTLLKEVEAKIDGPHQQLDVAMDELLQLLVPSRAGALSITLGDGSGLLSLTANNSAIGSASASLLNGVAPNAANPSVPGSVPASVNGEDTVHTTGEEHLEKRRKFHGMRVLAHNLLANLDEKNVVLTEANRVLAQQLLRLDSVMPLIDEEISEDARLGSMSHWAYSDNRQKKHAGGMLANRRDVAATNSLAAAANAIHESDIAQARREAVRETAREKHKGKSREHVDSDFEERPKKTHAKIAKIKAAGPNGEPMKRRKVDKGLAAPGMERSLSAVTKAMKGAKDTPRSTPLGETGRKPARAKPLPVPSKRKGPNAAQDSPALASSPLQSSFTGVSAEAANGRMQGARLRQSSAATNLRHERALEEQDSKPTSTIARVNGEKTNGKRKAPRDGQDAEYERAKTTIEGHDGAMPGDALVTETGPSGSTLNSGKAGRGSNAGTPKLENFSEMPAMVRSRSTRSMRGNHEDSSAEPQGGQRHKRNASNSHLVKQLAPFNRSPDMGRTRHDDMEDDLDSIDGGRKGAADEMHEVSRSPSKRLQRSRRNTGNLAPFSSPPLSEQHGNEGDEVADAIMADADGEAEHTDASEMPDLEPDIALTADDHELEQEVEDDESEEPGDPDDPDEPRYCYCNRGSYGEMIACDNDDCEREWFHLECTGLREPPDEAAKWYCEECKPLFVERERPSGRGGRGRGRGRGR